MRILTFYQYFCTPKGSWGTRHYELARRWVRDGHDVTIVTSIYDKSDLRADSFLSIRDVEGIRVVAINIVQSNKHGVLARAGTGIGFSLVALLYALREPADVVIASSGPITAGLPGLVATWARRLPLVFEVRDLQPEVWVAMGAMKHPLAIRATSLLARACYRSAKAVVALSPGMPPWITKVEPDVPVFHVANGCDVDLFKPTLPVSDEIRAATEGKFTLIYTGTLGAANACPEFLEIATELARRGEKDIQLVLIGDGKEKEELVAKAEERQLDNLTFLDLRPKTEIAEWHAATDVVLIGLKPFPILQTSSPNKLFDGLAAGRPILNNTGGWMAELLKEEGCGATYEPGDIEGAADLICKWRDSPELVKEMGERARRIAEGKYSRDNLASKYLGVLLEVVEASPRVDLEKLESRAST